jgi:hypothetical protein
MKDLNRNGRPLPPLTYQREDENDSRMCRVLSDCPLSRFECSDKLRTAKRFMHRIAAHFPIPTFLFGKTNSQVLDRMVRSREIGRRKVGEQL